MALPEYAVNLDNTYTTEQLLASVGDGDGTFLTERYVHHEQACATAEGAGNDELADLHRMVADLAAFCARLQSGNPIVAS